MCVCVCVGSRCAPATHIYLVPSLRFRICALHGPAAADRRLSVFAQNFSYFRLFDPWTAIDRTTVPSTPLSSRSSTRAREFLWPRCRGKFSSRSIARVRIEHRSRGNETEREDACSKSRFGSVGALDAEEERRGEVGEGFEMENTATVATAVVRHGRQRRQRLSKSTSPGGVGRHRSMARSVATPRRARRERTGGSFSLLPEFR